VLDAPIKSMGDAIESFVRLQVINFNLASKCASFFIKRWIKARVGIDIGEKENCAIVRTVSLPCVFLVSRTDEMTLFADQKRLIEDYGKLLPSTPKCQFYEINKRHCETRDTDVIVEALDLLARGLLVAGQSLSVELVRQERKQSVEGGVEDCSLSGQVAKDRKKYSKRHNSPLLTDLKNVDFSNMSEKHLASHSDLSLVLKDSFAEGPNRTVCHSLSQTPIHSLKHPTLHTIVSPSPRVPTHSQSWIGGNAPYGLYHSQTTQSKALLNCSEGLQSKNCLQNIFSSELESLANTHPIPRTQSMNELPQQTQLLQPQKVVNRNSLIETPSLKHSNAHQSNPHSSKPVKKERMLLIPDSSLAFHTEGNVRRVSVNTSVKQTWQGEPFVGHGLATNNHTTTQPSAVLRVVSPSYHNSMTQSKPEVNLYAMHVNVQNECSDNVIKEGLVKPIKVRPTVCKMELPPTATKQSIVSKDVSNKPKNGSSLKITLPQKVSQAIFRPSRVDQKNTVGYQGHRQV
jgi:hypothetical protein